MASENLRDHYEYPIDSWLSIQKEAQVKFAEEYGKGKVKIVKLITGAFLNFGDLNFAVSTEADH